MTPEELKSIFIPVHKRFHEDTPFTLENQQSILEEGLTEAVKTGLAQFRQEIEIEQSLLIDPQSEYMALITSTFEEIKGKLKAWDSEMRILVRVGGVQQIALQLAQTARLRIAAQRFAEKQVGWQPEELDEIRRGWVEFCDVIINDHKKYQSALVQSACIDWLKEEIEKNSGNTKAASVDAPANQGPTDEEKEQAVREILNPLNGCNPQGEKIMTIPDFNRLIDYTLHLVLTGILPERIIIIPQTRISSKHIRYTYYRLHLKLFGKISPYRGNFVFFLHASFSQFKNIECSTTSSKFSDKPASYYSDFSIQEIFGE